MPRTTQEKSDTQETFVDSNKMTIEGFEEWCRDTKQNFRVHFNMTHLDFVADKINELFDLDSDQGMRGEDLLSLIYREVANQDSGISSALETVKFFNHHSDITDYLDAENDLEALTKRAEKDIINERQKGRGLGWAFGTMVSTGLVLGSSAVIAMVETGGTAWSDLRGPHYAVLGILFTFAGFVGGSFGGGLLSCVTGPTANLLNKGRDKKLAKEQAPERARKAYEAKERAKANRLEEFENALAELKESKRLVLNDNPHDKKRFPVRFGRSVPAPI